MTLLCARETLCFPSRPQRSVAVLHSRDGDAQLHVGQHRLWKGRVLRFEGKKTPIGDSLSCFAGEGGRLRDPVHAARARGQQHDQDGGGHRGVPPHRIRVRQDQVPPQRHHHRQGLLPPRPHQDQAHGTRHHPPRSLARAACTAERNARGGETFLAFLRERLFEAPTFACFGSHHPLF